MLLLLPRHRTHLWIPQWCWLSENKAGVGGAGGGLAENRPVFGTADYVPPKNRWCWYSLITGRGATNTGGAGIPNTSQQA